MHSTISKLNVILSVILLLTAIAFFVFAQNNSSNNNSDNIPKICFENKCFEVEIADTIRKREIGLMNRKNLDLNSGMLFVFDQGGVYNLWMKNTLIPLDMIWIDGNNKVVFIEENAKPCRTEQCEVFGSDKKARYVLEVNGGVIEGMEIEVGDEVEFR